MKIHSFPSKPWLFLQSLQLPNVFFCPSHVDGRPTCVGLLNKPLSLCDPWLLCKAQGPFSASGLIIHRLTASHTWFLSVLLHARIMVAVVCALTLSNQTPTRDDFEQTEYIAACHMTSHRRNSCGVTAACCCIPQMLVHVALVVFVNLLSYCAECRSHLAVPHMVLGTRSVRTEPVKAHDIHTWFWVPHECWATGFTREAYGAGLYPSWPSRDSSAWGVCPAIVSSHFECTHYITAQQARGFARKQWHHRSTVHCLYRTLPCTVNVLNGLNALSAISCVSNMQSLVKKKYFLWMWTEYEYS